MLDRISMTKLPVLLLTATITPPMGVPVLARTCPAQRLRDYKRALEFYRDHLGSTFSGIVFCENSKSDLTELMTLTNPFGRIEFISFDGLDHPVSYGRGYGDYKLVDYAMEHSNLLQQADVIWKCTGRYIITNIDQLAQTRPNVDVYVHLRNYPYRLCDLYMMSFTPSGYERLIKGAYEYLRNDVVPGKHTDEEMSFRKLVDGWPKGGVRRRFKHTPLIDGIRGWDNSIYSKAWSPKTLLRRTLNVCIPSVWV